MNYNLINFCEFDPHATKSYCAIHNEKVKGISYFLDISRRIGTPSLMHLCESISNLNAISAMSFPILSRNPVH